VVEPSHADPLPHSYPPAQAALGGILDSTVISFALSSSVAAAAAASSSSSAAAPPPRRRLIIHDAGDGRSASDRGGNAEIAKLIRLTKVPIICICNDRQKPAVRTLAKYCLDVKFGPPSTASIAARLQGVAKGEGLRMEDAAVAQLVESVGGDLRQALNTMQVWALTERSLTGAGLRARKDAVAKDMNLRLDANSAAPRLFDTAIPLAAREELFFVDYDMIPLHVHQMYPGTLDKSTGAEAAKLNRLAKASAAVSDGDLFSTVVMRRQAWGMLPSVALANVRAAGWAAGPPSFVMFPAWLGKNSTAGKRSRLLAELGAAMSGSASGGRTAMRLDYAHALRARLFSPLERVDAGDKDAVVAAARGVSALLDEYNLTKVRRAPRAAPPRDGGAEEGVPPSPLLPPSLPTSAGRHDAEAGRGARL